MKIISKGDIEDDQCSGAAQDSGVFGMDFYLSGDGLGEHGPPQQEATESKGSTDADPFADLIAFMTGCGDSTVQDVVDEPMDSDTDSQAHLSDDEDLFNMRPASSMAMPETYRESNLEKHA